MLACTKATIQQNMMSLGSIHGLSRGSSNLARVLNLSVHVRVNIPKTRHHSDNSLAVVGEERGLALASAQA